MTATKLWIELTLEGDPDQQYDALIKTLDEGTYHFDGEVVVTSATVLRKDLHLGELTRRAIEEALRRTHGNQTRAAVLLGISRDQLRYKLTKSRRYDAPTEAQQRTILDKMGEIMAAPSSGPRPAGTGSANGPP